MSEEGKACFGCKKLRLSCARPRQAIEPTGLRNKVDEQTGLLQTAVKERDSELDNVRALLSISSDDISALEENLGQRLQLHYNEVGLLLPIAQEELEESRTQAGANREATATMARQIAVLIDRSWTYSGDN